MVLTRSKASKQDGTDPSMVTTPQLQGVAAKRKASPLASHSQPCKISKTDVAPDLSASITLVGNGDENGHGGKISADVPEESPALVLKAPPPTLATPITSSNMPVTDITTAVTAPGTVPTLSSSPSAVHDIVLTSVGASALAPTATPATTGQDTLVSTAPPAASLQALDSATHPSSEAQLLLGLAPPSAGTIPAMTTTVMLPTMPQQQEDPLLQSLKEPVPLEEPLPEVSTVLTNNLLDELTQLPDVSLQGQSSLAETNNGIGGKGGELLGTDSVQQSGPLSTEDSFVGSNLREQPLALLPLGSGKPTTTGSGKEREDVANN
ncbi:hypothetical protein BGZ94_002705 [Podila epigama]|nr:hypothetical protein BGZ94_002705 [Podila epigama]